MFTRLDYIGSAVGKRLIEHVVATGEWPNEYLNELFDLDRRKSQTKSGMQMSTNIPSAPVRLVRKQKQLLDVRYVLPM